MSIYNQKEIIQQLEEIRKTPRKMHASYLEKQGLLTQINELVPNTFKIKEKIDIILKGTYDKCDCGELTKANSKWCSLTCRNKDPEIRQSIGKKNSENKVSRSTKMKETLNQKYGVDCIQEIPGVKEKCKETWKINWGEDHYTRSEAYQTKAKEVCNEKHGVDYVFQLPAVQQKIKKTFFEKYGVGYHPIGNTSKAELEILEYCNSLHKGFDKNRIFGIEIDIFSEELNFGIEYCGLYWHQEKRRGKNQHKEKYDICKENGVRLITIFEDEWINNKELTKKKIAHILGFNYDKKVYARKCTIGLINKSDKETFLNYNHIQGNGNSSINLGLFYNTELVAVMGFIEHKNNKFELSRYATKYTIVGGFSKLLTFFKNNYDWNEIITFADLRWHEGESYSNSGFIIEKILPPDYSYFIGNKRFHKFNFRKELIKKKFPDMYNPNETEFENMDRIGIFRIYDCGKIKYVLKKGAEAPF